LSRCNNTEGSSYLGIGDGRDAAPIAEFHSVRRAQEFFQVAPQLLSPRKAVIRSQFPFIGAKMAELSLVGGAGV
jgi:hypothetical protein